MSTVAYALTTKEKVKARLTNVSGVTHDDLIDDLIDGVTDFIETFCDRRFKRTTYTQELYDGRNDGGFSKSTIRLKNYPIVTLTALQYKTGTSSWNDFLTTEYVVDYNSGFIEYVDGVFPNGYRNIRATYDAGYTIDFVTPANMTLPRDVINAATELVIRAFKRREHIGKTSQTSGGDTTSWLDTVDATVMMTLQKYRKLEFN